jgi:hypothetical protein
MSRTRPTTLLLAGLAAVATIGLTGCGAVGGTGHPQTVTPVPAAAATQLDPNAAAPVPAAGDATPVPAQKGAGVDPVPAGKAAGKDAAPAGKAAGKDQGQPPQPATKAAVTKLNASGAVCPVVATPGAPFSRPGSVKVSWTVTGAKGATLSIDGGLFSSDLPASGSQTLPFQCDGKGTTTHTYTVAPADPKGPAKSVKASATSDR